MVNHNLLRTLINNHRDTPLSLAIKSQLIAGNTRVHRYRAKRQQNVARQPINMALWIPYFTGLKVFIFKYLLLVYIPPTFSDLVQHIAIFNFMKNCAVILNQNITNYITLKSHTTFIQFSHSYCSIARTQS